MVLEDGSDNTRPGFIHAFRMDCRSRNTTVSRLQRTGKVTAREKTHLNTVFYWGDSFLHGCAVQSRWNVPARDLCGGLIVWWNFRTRLDVANCEARPCSERRRRATAAFA